LRHPGKFQQVSRLCVDTAATSLNGIQPNLARCLAVSWAGTLFTHFGGSCQVQNSLCVQVLRSPILAALLRGTRAVGVSQTVRRGTRNGITELSLLVIFNTGRHLYSDGGHHVGHRPIFWLWPPCVADADIIFLSCGFFYVLSSFFFFISSSNLSRRRLDVYHTSTHAVAQCVFRMQV